MSIKSNETYCINSTKQVLRNSIEEYKNNIDRLEKRLENYDKLVSESQELIVFEDDEFRTIKDVDELEDIEMHIDSNTFMRDKYAILSGKYEKCKLVAFDSDIIANPTKYKELVESHNKQYKNNLIELHKQKIEELDADVKYASSNIYYYSVNKENYKRQY